MSTRPFLRGYRHAALLLGLGLATSTFAADNLPPVTVQATVSKTVIGHSIYGSPIELATLTWHVGSADLNLRTYAGVKALQNRVREAARAACTKLDALYPLDDRQAPTCIRKAVADASRQMNAVIDGDRHAL
jgi:UrcA family protein